MNETKEMSPMMKQYYAAKEQHPDRLLLFRIGDFYEAFGEDAEAVSERIGLTLTKHGDLAMCGFPHMSLEKYLRELMECGCNIAVCDSVNDEEKKEIPKQEIEKVVVNETNDEKEDRGETQKLQGEDTSAYLAGGLQKYPDEVVSDKAWEMLTAKKEPEEVNQTNNDEEKGQQAANLQDVLTMNLIKSLLSNPPPSLNVGEFLDEMYKVKAMSYESSTGERKVLDPNVVLKRLNECVVLDERTDKIIEREGKTVRKRTKQNQMEVDNKPVEQTSEDESGEETNLLSHSNEVVAKEGVRVMIVKEKVAKEHLRSLGLTVPKSPRLLQSRLNRLHESLDKIKGEPAKEDLEFLRSVCSIIKDGGSIEVAKRGRKAKTNGDTVATDEESNGHSNGDVEEKPRNRSKGRPKMESMREYLQKKLPPIPRQYIKRQKYRALDAALMILQEEGRPMRAREIKELMEKRGYWKSKDGKTPPNTISVRLHNEIKTMGRKSRFKMHGRGLFTVR